MRIFLLLLDYAVSSVSRPRIVFVLPYLTTTFTLLVCGYLFIYLALTIYLGNYVVNNRYMID